MIVGSSLGGIAAQVVLAQAPQLVSHAVLIGTTPPGQLAKPGEALFYELARRENDFEDFVSLFSSQPQIPAEQQPRGPGHDWLHAWRIAAPKCLSSGRPSNSETAPRTRYFQPKRCCMHWRVLLSPYSTWARATTS
ncbi:hypothetical protein [Pseudomonas putida]|uniref:hypothetical protein n=1 Tax=Pseudomonas putida TaxID=303 RepID=UPI001967F8BC